MSCFLDSKVQGLPCAAPGQVAGVNPKFLEIRKNVYSACGLYPISVCNPYVVTSCVFSPTGWVRRHLTGREVCKIKGIPDNMIPVLSSSEIRSICQEPTLIPARVVHRMLECLNLEEDKELKNLKKAVTMTHPSTMEEMDPISFNLKRASENPSTNNIERNKRAVKSDDAEVPEYLWNQILVPDGDVAKLQALSQFRCFALRWWKRHLKREFVVWFCREHKLKRAPRSSRMDLLVIWEIELRSLLRRSKEANKDWVAGLECVS
jgi:hypothetical protein